MGVEGGHRRLRWKKVVLSAIVRNWMRVVERALSRMLWLCRRRALLCRDRVSDVDAGRQGGEVNDGHRVE